MLARLWIAFLTFLFGVLTIAWLVALMHEKDIRPVRKFVSFFKKQSKAGRVVLGGLFLVFWLVASVKPGNGDGGGNGGGTNNVQMVIGLCGGLQSLDSPGAVTNDQQQGFQGGIQPPQGGGMVGDLAPVTDEWSNFAPITSTNTTHTLTGEDFRRGFVMTRVGMGEAFDFSAPSNAVVCADWRAFGAATDWIYVAFTNWAFRVATNDVARLRIHSDGWVEAGGPASVPAMDGTEPVPPVFWPLKTILGIVPEANWHLLATNSPSQFWHCVTPSNTLQLTWQNALLDRDTDTPVSFQAEFWTDGRFTYRYDLSRLNMDTVTNVLAGASFAGNDWTTNAIPTNVTSMTFYPLTAEDAVNPDPDSDGLATIDELFVYHTDPRHPDSDYDGLTDYEELFVFHTNPLDPYSAGGPHCDGLAMKIGDLDPFDYPEGSTNTVLEHIFYSGTTNGAFAYPQSDTDTAILRVTVSGTGVGRLVVGDSVVPLVAPPPMRNDTTTNILLLAVGRGVRKEVWFDKPDGLDVAVKSGDFLIGEMPSPLRPRGWLAFPHTEATVPCIHDFNTRTKLVTLVHGEEFPDMTATWDNGGNEDVVLSNAPPVSAAIGGSFSKNSARAVSYTLDHPKRLNDAPVTLAQEVCFCSQVAPEDEPVAGGGAATGDADSPDGWGDDEPAPQPLDDDDVDAEEAFTNIVGGAFSPLCDVLYLYRDNTRTEYLEVPGGPPVRCCPCPEHWKSNYVAKVSYTGNVDVHDAAGNDFDIAYSPCAVTLSGVYPSRAFYDSPVHFVTNGALYKAHNYTVLGVGFESEPGRPAISNYNHRSPSFGYPVAVCTNLDYATSIILKTDVLLSNGVVRVSLEDASGDVALWLPKWESGGVERPAELLLKAGVRTSRHFTMRQWRSVMRRYEQTRQLAVRVVSSRPNRCKVKFEFAASDGTCYVHDHAEQQITTVNPLLLVDYNRDGKIDSVDVRSFLTGRVFRYWVNECRVVGAVWEEPSLFEGVANALVGLENWRNDHVDGTYDLINLFPVAINADPFIQAWQGCGDVKIRICSLDGNDAFRFTLASVGHSEAGSIRTAPCFNIAGQPLHGAMMNWLTNAVEIGASGYAGSFDAGSALLVCEAARPSSQGLFLSVEVDGTTMYTFRLPMRMSSVDDMFRFVSIRGAHDGEMTSFSGTGAPSNNPDGELADKDVFFVHGFNVSPENARNWNREMFKRFWVSGMNARYWGVTWSGDYHLGWPNFIAEKFNGLHYHRDVRQALMTAPTFRNLVNSNGVDSVVIGHSLGNMVVSEALLKNMNAKTYVMLDAAVASEAYRPELQANSTEIIDKYVPSDWDGYHERTWAANWYTWFTNDVNDARRKIGWAGHFAPLLDRQGLDIYNFYSSGDEVFNESTNGTSGLVTGVFHWPTLNFDWPFFHPNLELDAFPWQKQEVFKGVNAAGSLSAGWGFHCWTTNINNETVWVRYSASGANSMAADGSIVTNAVFDRGVTAMFSPTISDYDKADILAFHIPAVSSPAGKVATFPDEDMYFDMNINGRLNEWGRPRPAGHPMNQPMPWLHSDIKNMAYYYVYPAFTNIVEKGGMR